MLAARVLASAHIMTVAAAPRSRGHEAFGIETTEFRECRQAAADETVADLALFQGPLARPHQLVGQ